MKQTFPQKELIMYATLYSYNVNVCAH